MSGSVFVALKGVFVKNMLEEGREEPNLAQAVIGLRRLSIEHVEEA